ncbi:hypothetical protein [Actinomadura napierensis]|uniref:hypothetical protein n=1 Tax=Actinomadura napierensis TaxID=267854 RepID=UPI0031D6DC79
MRAAIADVRMLVLWLSDNWCRWGLRAPPDVLTALIYRRAADQAKYATMRSLPLASRPSCCMTVIRRLAMTVDPAWIARTVPGGHVSVPIRTGFRPAVPLTHTVHHTR